MSSAAAALVPPRRLARERPGKHGQASVRGTQAANGESFSICHCARSQMQTGQIRANGFASLQLVTPGPSQVPWARIGIQTRSGIISGKSHHISRKMGLSEAAMIGVTAATTFSLLDMTGPRASLCARTPARAVLWGCSRVSQATPLAVLIDLCRQGGHARGPPCNDCRAFAPVAGLDS